MIQLTRIKFGEFDEDVDMEVTYNTFSACTFLNIQEVIDLRNYLTTEINRVQPPVSENPKGNPNVSKDTKSQQY